MVDYDDVLWTELEFLRLHASIRRTISATDGAGGSRAEVKKKGAPPPLVHAADALDLRTRIDALQRKALRMLHRAQLESRSAGGGDSWPGVDPNTPDPEALADRYVAAVEDIKTRMAEREERREAGLGGESDAADTGDEAGVGAEGGGTRGHGGGAADGSVDSGDAVAGGGGSAAVDAAAEHADAGAGGLTPTADTDARSSLLGDGLRRRGERAGMGGEGEAAAAATTATSAGDENADAALVDAQRPVQDALTGEMLELVGRLKRNVQGISEDLVTDAAVLDATDAAVDANLAGVVRQRGSLATYAKRASLSWWTGLVGLGVALAVFLFVYLVVIKLPW